MASTTRMVDAFRAEWSRALQLLTRAIGCFNDHQWKSGLSQFEVPWKVAYHTVQCLAFYFRDDPSKQYRDIPLRFEKDWWALADENAPSQSAVLEYCNEMRARIDAYLEAMDDERLGAPFPGFGSVAGNLLYAMQHTLHHQGGLNVLAVHHEIDVDLWEIHGT